MIKILFSRIVYPQLRPPQKNNDFDGFSHFLEKLDIFVENIVKVELKIIENNKVTRMPTEASKQTKCFSRSAASN